MTMKSINTLLISSMVLVLAVVCCRPAVPTAEFGVSATSVQMENTGGVYDLELSSSDMWTASADQPWISVSPANGMSSAVCRISVDSTVLNTARKGLIRFRNSASGKTMDVAVNQDGFGYNINVVDQPAGLNHFAQADEREFEVVVRTNVPFSVVVPDNARNWLSCSEPEFSFERGDRPRNVRLKFKWGINSVPMEREAQISLVPEPGYEVISNDRISVRQSAAPVITVGHDGDSITVLSIGRSLNLLQPFVSAEPMANWDNVQLWEDTDPGYTPDKKGRVRSAYFSLFQTTEGIPYEVQYLTEAEELIFFSNVNSFLHDIDLGEHICKLKNLKRLTVSAYGLSSVPEEFAQLENLEWLDLSGNNLSSVPQVINPENFPKLHALLLNTCQRYYIMDLSNSVQSNLAGFRGPFPRRLLEWEQLDTLRLSVNYLEGEMPDMLDYEVKYTEQDCVDRNLPTTLVGTPKVLPNAKYFAFNLNRMYGKLPDWVLYHPNLDSWEPYALCYPQEGRATNGTAAAFSNVPVNMDYYWTFYDGYKEHKDIYIGD